MKLKRLTLIAEVVGVRSPDVRHHCVVKLMTSLPPTLDDVVFKFIQSQTKHVVYYTDY